MEDKLILNRERSDWRVLTKRSESPERHDRGGWAMGGKCSGLAKQKEGVKKEVISPALACSDNKHSRRKPHGCCWLEVQPSPDLLTRPIFGISVLVKFCV